MFRELESAKTTLEKVIKEYEKTASSLAAHKEDERIAIHIPQLERLRFVEATEIDTLMCDYEKNIGDFHQATKEYQVYSNTAYLIMTIGLVGMGVGIYLWYSRIQKFEDQIIRTRCLDQK
jgi:hypothetical protein